jgi:hypothetical protein
LPKADEFIVGWELNGYRAFFEQDDATGHLYLANSKEVLYALHIYNRRASLKIAEKDVEVLWTHSGDKCGVVILGKLRSVISLKGGQYRPANVMDSNGITEPEWAEGFDL